MKMMRAWMALQPLLVLLLVTMSSGESTGSVCPPGHQWSNDLGKCKDCRICDPASKDDFCQKCDDSDKTSDFPWLIVITATAVSVFFVTLVLGLAIYLARCRPKKKFTSEYPTLRYKDPRYSNHPYTTPEKHHITQHCTG
ncbi:uncharacterized protein ACNLHF_024967 [Anomaloglossus baeobatrachus]